MQVKPSQEFFAHHGTADGLQCDCKLCRSQARQDKRSLIAEGSYNGNVFAYTADGLAHGMKGWVATTRHSVDHAGMVERACGCCLLLCCAAQSAAFELVDDIVCCFRAGSHEQAAETAPQQSRGG